MMVCFDIFMGSVKTTSITLDFAFLMMILHPNIQKEVQQCIDTEFDGNWNISYADRSRYVWNSLLHYS